MITGVHAIIYSKNANKTRAFFGDTLGFRAVDAGDGWLIFALPPAELAGLLTSFKVPGASDLWLYEPRHPTAIKKRRRG